MYTGYWAIATDVDVYCVCLSVCRSRPWSEPRKKRWTDQDAVWGRLALEPCITLDAYDATWRIRLNDQKRRRCGLSLPLSYCSNLLAVDYDFSVRELLGSWKPGGIHYRRDRRHL